MFLTFQRIRKLLFFNYIFLALAGPAFSQGKAFTKYDSLRGCISSLRASYDVSFYDLTLEIDIQKKYISGSNKIYYTSTRDFKELQLDLFKNLRIDSILFRNERLNYRRDSNTVYITFSTMQNKSSRNFITVYYSGHPVVAQNAPWDGGFVWKTDSLGYPWVGVACEGIGASSWWPCKDHPSDEPDSMQMTFITPSDFSCISNGTLINKKNLTSKKTAHTWQVSYPINSYNVTLNIGNYTHFSEDYIRSNGSTLLLDFYVLDYNVEKARKHFTQVKKVMKGYEQLFGEYPFPKDGYALIETPYLGMEHQSAISYGNNYENKVADFDFIIVHETAHEWWGNSITASDLGELWIHESFATYSESLLLEYYYGYPYSIKYLLFQRINIKNKSPLLNPYNVNFFNPDDADIYYKGAWMLHTIRNVISNDSLWFKIMHNFSNNFRHSIVNTESIIDYFNKQSNMDLSLIFDQYLKFSDIPVLEYSLNKKGKKAILSYRWKADVAKFNMPVLLELGGKKTLKINPTTCFQTMALTSQEAEGLRVKTELFYIHTEILKNTAK